MRKVERNWKKYNQDLINRGNIGLLVDKEVLKNPRSSSRGRPYNEDFISFILLIQNIFNLNYRQLQGFVTYIIRDLMNDKDTPIPHFTTYGKCYKHLKITQKNHYKETIFDCKDIEALIDGTGITITHTGEWFRKKYGNKKNSKDNKKDNDKDKKNDNYRKSKDKFVKLHVLIDQDSMLCLSNTVTEASGKNTHDTTQYRPLLEKAKAYYKKIKRIKGDKAYDSKDNYKAANEAGADHICKVKSNVKGINDYYEREIAKIFQDLNLDLWYKKYGYNYRVLVESWFLRFKRIMGSRVRSRNFDNIIKELELKIYILNQYVMREISILNVPARMQDIEKIAELASR